MITRVRDMVHKWIHLTSIEQHIIDHILFERLRYISQNDVGQMVYPSLNTTRFEHCLGTCHVAGSMAEHIVQSKCWTEYAKELKAKLAISKKEDFIQLCRFYALLHDVGHLPYSHLFENALLSYAERTGNNSFVKDWFGTGDFEKPHEAYTAELVRRILNDVRMNSSLRNATITLLSQKGFEPGSVLFPIKQVVDSQIDADRIDFVARDGMKAGGEYGNYDIERLCESVRLVSDDDGWFLSYADHAMSAMEALLFDRYRLYLWVHYHHRVIAIRALGQFLIETLITDGVLTSKDFCPDSNTNEDLFGRTDAWLWNIILQMDCQGRREVEIARKAFLWREKSGTLHLWKRRVDYQELLNQLEKQVGVRKRGQDIFALGSPVQYEDSLVAKIGPRPLVFRIKFAPVKDYAIPIHYENKEGKKGFSLQEASPLVSTLNALWDQEPDHQILFIGDDLVRSSIIRLWINKTTDWLISAIST